MKRSKLFSAFLLLVLMLSLVTVQTVAQEPDAELATPNADRPLSPGAPRRATHASSPVEPAPPPRPQQDLPVQAGWQYGPTSDFQYQRFDGVFVPGPDGEPWANKVYFMGGRTSAPTEAPDIWMFDPITGQYTDTQTDMLEDVSNYNMNLVMDDGTGFGPALYVIGGYDKDSGGGNLGLVQRYYPQLNYIESLPPADDWPGEVSGLKVGSMGSAVVNDLIYVFGGWQSSVAPYFSDETWILDPTQPSGSRWTNLNVPLGTARCYLQSAAQNGKIYALGGIYEYTGSDLVPTADVEVLDTSNPGAGWSYVAAMPIPVGEGRAFGFDDDTLYGTNAPWHGKLYVAGGGDWPEYDLVVMEYDIASDTWNADFPDMNEERGGPAGVFIPLCTADPNDGLPGMWMFGGRWDSG
jgi:hypothetical protein